MVARFLLLAFIVWATSLILYPLYFLLQRIPISELNLPAIAVGALIIVSLCLTVIGIPIFAFARKLGFADVLAAMVAICGLAGALTAAAVIGLIYDDAFALAPIASIGFVIYGAILGSFAALVWRKIGPRKLGDA